jgi:cytochrome o ubiquinol oxidase subunit 3
MHNEAIIHKHHEHHDADATDVFGFWLYIMTDCILFGSLFAAFIVLNLPSVMGPSLKDYIYLPNILIETFLLLASNFTFCLSILNLYQHKLLKVQLWLIFTFILGASFVFLEITEFTHLVHEGMSWNVHGKISAFFTLVGTHGLHVSIGLLWILLMIFQLPLLKNKIEIAKRRMTYLGLFWNFLDIVWIFVFTIVYLMGAM